MTSEYSEDDSNIFVRCSLCKSSLSIYISTTDSYGNILCPKCLSAGVDNLPMGNNFPSFASDPAQ